MFLWLSQLPGLPGRREQGQHPSGRRQDEEGALPQEGFGEPTSASQPCFRGLLLIPFYQQQQPRADSQLDPLNLSLWLTSLVVFLWLLACDALKVQDFPFVSFSFSRPLSVCVLGFNL